jgi:EAL domain-containing protein (putative c-di-GMP-specific phosphodiesterase class I)
VETPAQRALLIEAGCDYAQGYMFGYPMTAAELEQLALRGAPA